MTKSWWRPPSGVWLPQVACTVMASFGRPNCWVQLLLWMWIHLGRGMHRLQRELHGLPLTNTILHLCLSPVEASPAESWVCTPFLWHSQWQKEKISTGNKEKIRLERLIRKKRKGYRSTIWEGNNIGAVDSAGSVLRQDVFKKPLHHCLDASFLFLHKLGDSVNQNWRPFLPFLVSLLSFNFY